jgi:membrane protein
VRLIIRHLPWLLRRTLIATIDDGLFGMAKGAAYSALLAFFPLLTSAAAVFVETRTQVVENYLARFLGQILPPGTENVVLENFRFVGRRPVGLIIVAVTLAVFAASSVIKSLIDGFNAAYKVPRNRSIAAHFGMGMLLVLLCVIPLLTASFVILFGETTENFLLTMLGHDPAFGSPGPWWDISTAFARYTLAVLASIGLTLTLYYFGPYRKQTWKGVLPGALLTTSLWAAATFGFGWYVRNVTNYNVLYGSVGTSMALVVWMYLLSVIALIGCEFNAEIERLQTALASQPGH